MPTLSDQLQETLRTLPEPHVDVLVDRAIAAGRHRTRRTAGAVVVTGVTTLALAGVAIGTQLVPGHQSLAPLGPPSATPSAAASASSSAPARPDRKAVSDEMLRILRLHLPAGTTITHWSENTSTDSPYSLVMTLRDAKGTTTFFLSLETQDSAVTTSCDAVDTGADPMLLCRTGTFGAGSLTWLNERYADVDGSKTLGVLRLSDGSTVSLGENNTTTYGPDGKHRKLTRPGQIFNQDSAWALLKDPAWQALLDRLS